MQRSIISTLSLTEIFEGLTTTQLELIESICEPAKPKKGTILFNENDGSDDMYVIARGSIEILMDPGVISVARSTESVVLTELQQGQVIGEIALVDQGLRSATARVCEKNTELLRIPRKRLMLLCNTYPELGYKVMRNLAADLALKIRKTDLNIRQYQLVQAKQMG